MKRTGEVNTDVQRIIKINWSALKISQCILTAILTPMSIFLTQLLIDYIQLYSKGSIGIAPIYGIFGLLLLSYLFLAGSSFFDSLINILLKRKMNQTLTTTIVHKFLALEYVCFEDTKVADTLNRMGGEPQIKILSIFLDTLNSLTLLITCQLPLSQ